MCDTKPLRKAPLSGCLPFGIRCSLSARLKRVVSRPFHWKRHTEKEAETSPLALVNPQVLFKMQITANKFDCIGFVCRSSMSSAFSYQCTSYQCTSDRYQLSSSMLMRLPHLNDTSQTRLHIFSRSFNSGTDLHR